MMLSTSLLWISLSVFLSLLLPLLLPITFSSAYGLNQELPCLLGRNDVGGSYGPHLVVSTKPNHCLIQAESSRPTN